MGWLSTALPSGLPVDGNFVNQLARAARQATSDRAALIGFCSDVLHLASGWKLGQRLAHFRIGG